MSELVSGIYLLYFNSIVDKFYVGLSIDVHSRVASHKAKLALGTHKNDLLQEAYNSVLELPCSYILETCQEAKLSSREIYWIDKFDAYTEGFNKNKGGLHKFGAFGGNATHTEEEYLQVFFDIVNTNKSLKTISSDRNVSYEAVRDIACGKSHKYLAEVFPKEYKLLLEKSGSRSTSKYTKERYISVLTTISSSSLTLKEVSLKLDISYSVVRNIAYGSSHKYLEREFPIEYLLMRTKTRLNKGGVWQVTQ